MILSKQRILQLMEFHHIIQTMEFENQGNSIESLIQTHS
jgi:hypothetical protein